MHTRTLPALVPFVLPRTGCAVGVTHQLEAATPTARSGETLDSFVASTVARRRSAVSGKEPESFVVFSCAGFGNPLDVNTASGRALARDFSKVLASAPSSTSARH
ncbi:MAG: hypothetical protein J5X21_11050 [Candidatus Accumulibacter sp.]|jgi:hypothetical protein|nr:hypothetical protein [Candidatus Accumulibacter conexus]